MSEAVKMLLVVFAFLVTSGENGSAVANTISFVRNLFDRHDT